MKDEKYWINHLDLLPHPEGGYFKEVYRSQEILNQSALDERFKGNRVYYTSIYFLITSNNPSKFHKVMADELWHFLYGNKIKMHFIDRNGNYYTVKLGLDIENGESPTHLVPHNTWMAAEIISDDSYGLVGCTTAPGFEFDDFIMADRSKLSDNYPDLKSIIHKYT